jgi:AMP nucleosidase
MDATNYLASLTGHSEPGRFTIRTKPSKSREEIDQQLQIIYEYICFLDTTSCQGMYESHEWLLGCNDDFFKNLEAAFDKTFDKIKNCCYPYISVPERSSVDFLGDQEAYSAAYRMLLAPISHTITVADPQCFPTYLRSQILRLLEEGFEIEVGLSVVPIPLPFAAEHIGRPLANLPERLAEITQSFFPMANIADIEDSLVDATFKKRNASSFVNHEYQLFFSRFWQRYKRYLSNYSTENWKSERLRGIEAAITSKRALLLSDSKFTESFYFDDLPSRLSVDQPITRQPMLFPKRLAFFDALRVDYSLLRLRHYTHTPPGKFQEHILLVNYPFYVHLFLMRVIAEICKDSGANGGVLVIPDGRNRQKTSYAYADLVDELGNESISYIVDSFIGTNALTRDEALYQKVDEAIGSLVLHDAQMPAYHFVPSKGDGVQPRNDSESDQAYRAYVLEHGPLPGITLINIGVGASNAWNITDHLAVLRPLCWIMVGHCGGLRSRQKVGDYVIANGYVRRDGALEESVPIDAPVQPTRVINLALQNAVLHRILAGKLKVTESPQGSLVGRDGWQPRRASGLTDEQSSKVDRQIRQQEALRSLLRSGTVMSVTNRNWETAPTEDMFQMFEQYRVVGIDMESAAIAANAYRYRISHATFLCVSDKPVHGALKAAREANSFYRTQTGQHLNIAIDGIKLLKSIASDALDLLHARELRGMDDPPFR